MALRLDSGVIAYWDDNPITSAQFTVDLLFRAFSDIGTWPTGGATWGPGTGVELLHTQAIGFGQQPSFGIYAINGDNTTNTNPIPSATGQLAVEFAIASSMTWFSLSGMFGDDEVFRIGLSVDWTATGNSKLIVTKNGVDVTSDGIFVGSWYDNTGANWIARVTGQNFCLQYGDFDEIAAWRQTATVAQLLEVATSGVSGTSLGDPDFWAKVDNTQTDDGTDGITAHSISGNYTYIDSLPAPVPPACNDLTFAQSIAAENASFVVYATIEGCGDSTGLWRFCSTTPHFAQADGDAPDIAHWREWLAAWPDILNEGDPGEEGSVLEAAELNLELVDIDDALTSEWKTEAAPTTYLAEALTSAETGIDVEDASGIATGDVIYIASEAMVVTGKASNTLTVTRGALDTTAVAIVTGAPVYTAIPYLLSRRVRLYVVNAEACAEDEAREVGQFKLDARSLDDGLNVYQLRAAGQLVFASALVCRRQPNRYKVRASFQSGKISVEPRGAMDPKYAPIPVWSDPTMFLKLGDEVALAENVSGESARPIFQLTGRGTHGTEVSDSTAATEVAVVFGFEPEGTTTFFQYSPGPSPSTSRASGTWIPSAHWIDLILMLLVSSADDADGLELANYVDAYGNWSSLPPGIGIGQRAAAVDWSAALEVRARTPDFRFESFYLGTEPVAFGELVTQEFLRPVGAYLSTAGGLLRVVLPRLPVLGESSFTIGEDDILTREVGARRMGMGVRVTQDMSGIASSIAYEVGRGRSRSSIIINDADFDSTYGAKGYNEHETRRIKIEVPSARPETDGSLAFLLDRGMARLARRRWPATTLAVSLPLSYFDNAVGDTGSITHSEIPDMARGLRGVTGLQVEMRSRRIRLAPDAAAIEVALRADRAGARRGVIAPCARVVSVASGGGGTFVVTVSANRFTDAEADEAGLPVTDASAFAVGDVISLRDTSGALVDSTTQTITAIAGNDVTVDGDFGGSITAGTGQAGDVIAYATAASATPDQSDARVYQADRATRQIAGIGADPFSFGEV